jgi:hypothetical protein
MGKQCPYCKRKLGIRKGFRKTRYGRKQVYLCKNPDCKNPKTNKPGRKFTPQDIYWQKKYPPELIKQAYNQCCFTNFGRLASFREVSKSIARQYGYNLSPTTISNWVKEIEMKRKKIKSPRWAVFLKK